jgi:hypothetical protein
MENNLRDEHGRFKKGIYNGCGFKKGDKLRLGKHHSEKSRNQMSLTKKRLFKEGKIKPTITHYWLGKKRGEPTEEHKRKNSEAKKKMYEEGKIIPYWKGKNIPEVIKERLRTLRLGTKETEQHKLKIGLGLKKAYDTGKRKRIFAGEPSIKTFLSWKDKSKLESKFENLIVKLGLPYRFVGLGDCIIAKKCPDFINSDGEKIAIEVYYKKHKNFFKGNVEVWKAERLKIFNQEGYELIFFDETEINEEKIKEKLGDVKYGC